MVANMVNRLCSIGTCLGTQREHAGNHDVWGNPIREGLGGNVPSWEFEGMDSLKTQECRPAERVPCGSEIFFQIGTCMFPNMFPNTFPNIPGTCEPAKNAAIELNITKNMPRLAWPDLKS
eukprot:scaffold1867_cov186-Chaetoceros_neogracile.AAC.9